MKKLWKMLLLTGVCTVLLGVSALAADGAGMYGVEGVTPDRTTTQTVTINGVEETLYVGAEKVDLTYDKAVEGCYYLVVALNDASPVPTASNIAYINQDTAKGTTVDFTVYPGKLEHGKTYTVYLSSNDGKLTTLTKQGAFSYYVSYTLGDVDGENGINVNDAMAVINHIVDKNKLTGNALLAADVTGDQEVNINDAMEIINYIVGRPEYLGKP